MEKIKKQTLKDVNWPVAGNDTFVKMPWGH